MGICNYSVSHCTLIFLRELLIFNGMDFRTGNTNNAQNSKRRESSGGGIAIGHTLRKRENATLSIVGALVAASPKQLRIRGANSKHIHVVVPPKMRLPSLKNGTKD